MSPTGVGTRPTRSADARYDDIRIPGRRNRACRGMRPHCKADCERRASRAILARSNALNLLRLSFTAGAAGYLKLLQLVLCWVRQRAFVLENLAEITAIDPAVARWAPDEVFGLVRRRVAETLPDVFAARDRHFGVGSCVIANPLPPSLQRVLSLVLFQSMHARVTLFQPQKTRKQNVTETRDYCYRHFLWARSDCVVCFRPRRRVYGGAEGCLRRRRPAAVQFIHVGPSAVDRLYAEQPKQGQLALSGSDGWWWQEEESWLITRISPRRLDGAGGFGCRIVLLRRTESARSLDQQAPAP
jgi:hypothetical protein